MASPQRLKTKFGSLCRMTFPPWKEFLQEHDDRLTQPVALHCIGGFAVVTAYKLPRSTNDLDYFNILSSKIVAEIQELAGEGAPLAKKYNVHVYPAAVATLPYGYEDRLTELFPERFKNCASLSSILMTWSCQS